MVKFLFIVWNLSTGQIVINFNGGSRAAHKLVGGRMRPVGQGLKITGKMLIFDS